MALIQIDAVYENGVLRPTEPLPFREHARVKITVESEVSLARQSAGMIPWTGDMETLQRLICDPEFGIHESP